jgi:hypothetical protein
MSNTDYGQYLPVEFGLFYYEFYDNKITLVWETYSEINKSPQLIVAPFCWA